MGRPRGKSGNKSPRFVRLRHDLLDNYDFINLNYTAKSLLIDVLRQFNGSNNGDFCITLSVMKRRGWTSNDTLRNAAKELIKANLLILTRQGGRNSCNLYGVTWEPINECKGKIDIKPTLTPLRKLSV